MRSADRAARNVTLSGTVVVVMAALAVVGVVSGLDPSDTYATGNGSTVAPGAALTPERLSRLSDPT